MTSPSTAATLKARLTNDAQWLERLGDCYHADSLTQRNYRAVAANVREAAERTESAERQLAEATLKLRLYENGTSPNQPLVDDIERWRVESEQAIAEAAAKLEKVETGCGVCNRKHVNDVLRRLRSHCYECHRVDPDDEQTPATAECMRCGELDCPHNEPLHYHHDGCPACTSDDRCGEKSARIPLDRGEALASVSPPPSPIERGEKANPYPVSPPPSQETHEDSSV